ncbi:MAG TPA: HTH domain-containing protein [Jiangellales bacterium]|nr:HTH domain-containing protein [Jiangellales bacterium]
MNRIDRLYALVEALRAAGPRGQTARQLAAHFEVSVRTIERDLARTRVGLTHSSGGEAGFVATDRDGSHRPEQDRH